MVTCRSALRRCATGSGTDCAHSARASSRWRKQSTRCSSSRTRKRSQEPAAEVGVSRLVDILNSYGQTRKDAVTGGGASGRAVATPAGSQENRGGARSWLRRRTSSPLRPRARRFIAQREQHPPGEGGDGGGYGPDRGHVHREHPLTTPAALPERAP